MKKIYLGGGCFWGMQGYYQRIKGVVKTSVGYGNGKTLNPTYEEVCRHTTGFCEMVEVEYDEQVISLNKILEYFFLVVDPTQLNQQAHDIGDQYRNGIYYVDDKDLPIIQEYLKQEQTRHHKLMVTECEPLANYYLAEDYHQDYLIKNPTGYCHINFDVLRNH